MKRLFWLLSYHNAFPITAILLTAGTGAVFAAQPDLMFSKEEMVTAIDNTYLVNVNLGTYTPTAQIMSVSEDEDNYYVAYDLSTIALRDAVWQETVEREMLTVSKTVLGGRDLGLYAIEELRQRVARERELLTRAQAIEREQVSQKKVATVYGGLLGKMLNDKTETLPGYAPVVKPLRPALEEAPVIPRALPDSPVPTQTATPTPQESPPIESASPTPEPSASPEPTPTPEPEPTPGSTPEPAPEATPESTPDPTPEPTPEPEGTSETTE